MPQGQTNQAANQAMNRLSARAIEKNGTKMVRTATAKKLFYLFASFNKTKSGEEKTTNQHT
jgi:hypothetical protein